MANGGRRPGAGRPTGSLSKKTIETRAAEALLHQRILKSVDRVFNAQLALAQGLTYLYRIDEVGEGKDKRREHVLVTGPEEIKQVLDEAEGNGVVDDSYYYMTVKPPDNKAIDSMLDRMFGKAVTKAEVTGKGGKDLFPVPILGTAPSAPRARPAVSTAHSNSSRTWISNCRTALWLARVPTRVVSQVGQLERAPA